MLVTAVAFWLKTTCVNSFAGFGTKLTLFVLASSSIPTSMMVTSEVVVSAPQLLLAIKVTVYVPIAL
jgi:hypothetical protein